MLKNYTVTPSAETETDLIAAVGTGKAVVIDNILITAPTAAEVELRLHDGTDIYHSILLIISNDGDTGGIDGKMIIPADHALKVYSDRADTEFTAFGVETDNA